MTLLAFLLPWHCNGLSVSGPCCKMAGHWGQRCSLQWPFPIGPAWIYRPLGCTEAPSSVGRAVGLLHKRRMPHQTWRPWRARFLRTGPMPLLGISSPLRPPPCCLDRAGQLAGPLLQHRQTFQINITKMDRSSVLDSAQQKTHHIGNIAVCRNGIS